MILEYTLSSKGYQIQVSENIHFLILTSDIFLSNKLNGL